MDIKTIEHIITQLVNIVDRVNIDDKSPNDTLLIWSEKKFHQQLLEKMTQTIDYCKAELSSCIDWKKDLMQKAQLIISKLCNIGHFTTEVEN